MSSDAVSKEKDVNNILTVVGTGLKGAEWFTRLEAGGHKTCNLVRKIILEPNYDKYHRLEMGRKYTLALVRGSRIKEINKRTTSALKVIGENDYGCQASIGLRAEFGLLIREKLINSHLSAMELNSITILHIPITVHGPCVLTVQNNFYISASPDSSHTLWQGYRDAFAFLVK